MAREIFPGVVAFDDGRILTKNLAPGQRVYGEELHTVDGGEYRVWDPSRSKLGAYIMKGGKHFPFAPDANILYLGAANGTTTSHVSDIVSRGVVVAVEFSPRSFRDLLRTSGPRENLMPILADAWRPELYDRYLGKIDVMFQDIAQRQQAQIFAKNINRFKPAWAMIAVKARSVDVTAHPRDVYEDVSRMVEELTGYDAIETVDLGPYERDHAAVVFRPGEPGRKPQDKPAIKAERRAPPPPRDDRRDDRRERSAPPREDKPRFQKSGFKPREERGGGFGGGGGGGGKPKSDNRGREERRPDRRGWR